MREFVSHELRDLRCRVDSGKAHSKEIPFVEKMRLQIMQNLVITVENLHISYEMKSSEKLGHPFSFGFTLQYLQLQVRTRRGTRTLPSPRRQRRMPGSVDEFKAIHSSSTKSVCIDRPTRRHSRRALQVNEMRSFSLYWNSNCTSRLNVPFNDVLVRCFRPNIPPAHARLSFRTI